MSCWQFYLRFPSSFTAFDIEILRDPSLLLSQCTRRLNHDALGGKRDPQATYTLPTQPASPLIPDHGSCHIHAEPPAPTPSERQCREPSSLRPYGAIVAMGSGRRPCHVLRKSALRSCHFSLAPRDCTAGFPPLGAVATRSNPEH